MQDAALPECAGLGGQDSGRPEAIRPLPLVVALPLIAGLSVALWVGLSRIVCAALG